MGTFEEDNSQQSDAGGIVRHLWVRVNRRPVERIAGFHQIVIEPAGFQYGREFLLRRPIQNGLAVQRPIEVDVRVFEASP